MAITAAEQTSIVRLVVGMFNAAPGATFLNTISGIYESNGHNLTSLAALLANTGAFTSIYNTGLTSQQFATSFLSTLGLQDNQLANDFIIAKANSGENRGDIILDAINALESLPANATGLFDDARDLLNNRTEVALFFSITLNNPSTSLATLQGALDGVTNDHNSVAAVEFNLQNPPQDLNLTINADHLTGGAGNDTFTADAALSTVDLILRPTLGGNDVLDGGDGFDVLNAVVNGAFGLAAGDDPHISAIEEINFTVRASGSLFTPDDAFAAIDFGHVSGVNVINMNDSNDGAGLDIFNVQEAVDIGIHNLEDGYMDLEFDADALGSETASQNVTIEDVDGVSLYLETDGDDVITALNLQVQGGGDNDLSIEVADNGGTGDYSTLQDLTITGDGSLTIRDYYDFDELVTLNSTGLSGDLDIDVSGSTDLESALTGGGDDFVVVNPGLFDGESEVTIDLGGGDNTLSMFHEEDITDSDLNAIDFSAATISNVQTLELNGQVELYADTALDVSTIGGLSTLSITDDFFDNNYDFALTGPATLTLDVGGQIDQLDMTTSGILDLTVKTHDGDLDLDSLTSDDIVSLTLNADGNAWVDLDGTEDNLVTLANVSVTAGDAVSLEMFGDAGTPATGGATESGSISFTGFTEVDENAATKGKHTHTFGGTVTLTSASLDGSPLVVDVSGSKDANAVAHTVALALDALDGITATDDGKGTITYSYDAEGTKTDLAASFTGTQSDGDTVTVTPAINTQGAAPTVGGTDAAGFEGLTTVMVNAGTTAHVDIEDAFGAFTASVTSVNDADVTLIDTGVTSVDVTSTKGNVTLDVESADGLTSASATAKDAAVVTISDAEALTTVAITAGDDNGLNSLVLTNTDSVSTIDLTHITDNDDDELSGNASIDVDVTNADFAGGVQILVGAEDMTFHMAGNDGVRETFTFVGSDTGAVVIDNGADADGFLASVGGTGDRLDFSQMAGIDSLDDLAIVFDTTTGNTHITSLVAGINVDITVVGADVSLDAFHFIF